VFNYIFISSLWNECFNLELFMNCSTDIEVWDNNFRR